MKALSRKGAIRMIKGTGQNAVTQYHCGKINKARKNGVNVLVARKHKETGKIEEVPAKATLHHRDITAVYGDTHLRAGEGKFVNNKAFNKNRTKVFGAQHVNPYLPGGVEDGRARCYYAIIETFKKIAGLTALSKLSGKVIYGADTEFGDHITWTGRRDSDGLLISARPMTEEGTWQATLKAFPEILKMLRTSKSSLKSVAAYKSAREKFLTDLDVVTRSSLTTDLSTGITEITGGRTPYGFPLQQVEFTLDKRFLTSSVNADGSEEAQYYYIFGVGRKDSHTLPTKSWRHEGMDSQVAFLTPRKSRSKKSAA